MRVLLYKEIDLFLRCCAVGKPWYYTISSFRHGYLLAKSPFKITGGGAAPVSVVMLRPVYGGFVPVQVRPRRFRPVRFCPILQVRTAEVSSHMYKMYMQKCKYTVFHCQRNFIFFLSISKTDNYLKNNMANYHLHSMSIFLHYLTSMPV